MCVRVEWSLSDMTRWWGGRDGGNQGGSYVALRDDETL